MKKHINKIVLSFMVLLTVGFSAGLISWSGSREEPVDAYRLFDYRITSENGFSKEELKAIELEGFGYMTMTASRSADLRLKNGRSVCVFSAGAPFDRAELLKGRMPEKSGEWSAGDR